MMSTLELKIREILLQARISKAYKGYPFLEYAIYLVIENESRLCHIYNEVYVKVAENFGVAPTAVEKIFGHSVMPSGKTPATNTLKNNAALSFTIARSQEKLLKFLQNR